MAEVMGLPCATIIMNIEPAGNGVKVKRELEDGWFQHVEMPLPALLTVQSGATKLRYATLMGIKKAKTKEIRRIPAEPGGQASIRLDRVYTPEKTKRSQIFDGPPKEAAAKLVEKLRFEARVL
jgi:electron transfer flavoprotein beta subunit